MSTRAYIFEGGKCYIIYNPCSCEGDNEINLYSFIIHFKIDFDGGENNGNSLKSQNIQ